MKVSIDYEGEVKGMDRVVAAVVRECTGLDYMRIEEACEHIGRLLREISMCAWVCRASAEESGRYFGYELDVSVTEKGLEWKQPVRTAAAAPPPPAAAYQTARHSLERIAALCCVVRSVYAVFASPGLMQRRDWYD